MQPAAFPARERKRVGEMKYQIPLQMLSMDGLPYLIKGEPYYNHQKEKKSLEKFKR